MCLVRESRYFLGRAFFRHFCSRHLNVCLCASSSFKNVLHCPTFLPHPCATFVDGSRHLWKRLVSTKLDGLWKISTFVSRCSYFPEHVRECVGRKGFILQPPWRIRRSAPRVRGREWGGEGGKGEPSLRSLFGHGHGARRHVPARVASIDRAGSPLPGRLTSIRTSCRGKEHCQISCVMRA